MAVLTILMELSDSGHYTLDYSKPIDDSYTSALWRLISDGIIYISATTSTNETYRKL